TYGSYNRIDLRAMADIGLADNLAVRFAGVSKNEDGFIKRLDYAATHPGTNVPTQATGGGKSNEVLGTLGGQSVIGGKMALRSHATPGIEVIFSAGYTRGRNDPGLATLLYATAEGVSNGRPNRPWLRGTDGATIPYNCMFVPSGVN